MDVTRTISYEGSDEGLAFLVGLLMNEGVHVEPAPGEDGLRLIDGLQELHEAQAQEWQDLTDQHAQERRKLDKRQSRKRLELAERHVRERGELAERRKQAPADDERNERERSELAEGQAQERRELDDRQSRERWELDQRQTWERQELHKRQSRERLEAPDFLEQAPEKLEQKLEENAWLNVITSDVNQVIVSLIGSGSLMAITAAVKKLRERVPHAKIVVTEEAPDQGDDSTHPRPAHASADGRDDGGDAAPR
jgi:hypothetical protein